MSVTIESITAKLQAPRQLRNIHEQPIRLDGQQKAVLTLMCAGYQHKQIAFKLELKLAVIRDTSSRILHLSGCKTQSQLGAWAAKRGLV